MSGCDHLDDGSLVAAFDALAIPPQDFRHREHVRLAFALLRRDGDLASAAVAFRIGLRRFAAAASVAGKYHETITWAYLAIIAERMAGNTYASSNELLLTNPDLLAHQGGALARHYDVAELLASPHARATFVLPQKS
jgi:hypothetical protein